MEAAGSGLTMEQIVIETGDVSIESDVIIVETENGEQYFPIGAATAAVVTYMARASANDSFVISLGGQVVVKRVIIRITAATQGANLVDITKVEISHDGVTEVVRTAANTLKVSSFRMRLMLSLSRRQGRLLRRQPRVSRKLRRRLRLQRQKARQWKHSGRKAEAKKQTESLYFSFPLWLLALLQRYITYCIVIIGRNKSKFKKAVHRRLRLICHRSGCFGGRFALETWKRQIGYGTCRAVSSMGNILSKYVDTPHYYISNY